MPNYNKKISDTTIRIGEVRFSYVNVFAPRKKEDGTPGKYGVTPVIPKSDTATIKLINDAINAAKELAKTKGIKLTSACKTPLRDGDIDREEDPNFADSYFMNCNCGKKPGVMVLENGVLSEALDEDDFYSGCYGAVTINFFPYDSNGNKGIGAGLNNVVKTKDGDRLSGGTSALNDFGDLAADLSCLN